MTTPLRYEQWSDWLLNLGAVATPAELQGMLCGRLCGGQRLDESPWLEAAVEFIDLVEDDASSLDETMRGHLIALYQINLAQLSDPARALTLMLPPDEVELRPRINALAGWCEAFLHGLGASGLKGSHELPTSVAETLRDFAQISQAEVDEEQAEENEVYYTELVEYVKVAALNLFADLNPPAPTASGNLH